MGQDELTRFDKVFKKKKKKKKPQNRNNDNRSGGNQNNPQAKKKDGNNQGGPKKGGNNRNNRNKNKLLKIIYGIKMIKSVLILIYLILLRSMIFILTFEQPTHMNGLTYICLLK